MLMDPRRVVTLGLMAFLLIVLVAVVTACAPACPNGYERVRVGEHMSLMLVGKVLVPHTVGEYECHPLPAATR